VTLSATFGGHERYICVPFGDSKRYIWVTRSATFGDPKRYNLVTPNARVLSLRTRIHLVLYLGIGKHSRWRKAKWEGLGKLGPRPSILNRLLFLSAHTSGMGKGGRGRGLEGGEEEEEVRWR
jgi:hypothetical protein